jgi:retinol-binding protein 3
LLVALSCGPVLAQQIRSTSSTASDFQGSVHGTIQTLDALIEQKYFNKAAIPRITHALLDAESRGEYASVTEPKDFARRLTDTLYAASRDKHLYVLPTPASALGSAPSLPRAERARMENFGFTKAAILRGNIGYLKVDAFYRASEGAKTEEAAMNYLANVDALIVDLRENGGGSPDTAIQLLSYFFKQSSLPLLSIVPRSGDNIVYKTIVAGVSYRNESLPLYVLVSGSTFSAGEAVPFILQERHRATIIGETTAGAANPESPWPLTSSLSVTIPFGHIKSAVLRANWEGDGVHPDVTTSRGEALNIARIQALNKLVSSTSDPVKRSLLIEDSQRAQDTTP